MRIVRIAKLDDEAIICPYEWPIILLLTVPEGVKTKWPIYQNRKWYNKVFHEREYGQLVHNVSIIDPTEIVDDNGLLGCAERTNTLALEFDKWHNLYMLRILSHL